MVARKLEGVFAFTVTTTKDDGATVDFE